MFVMGNQNHVLSKIISCQLIFKFNCLTMKDDLMNLYLKFIAYVKNYGLSDV